MGLGGSEYNNYFGYSVNSVIWSIFIRVDKKTIGLFALAIVRGFIIKLAEKCTNGLRGLTWSCTQEIF